MGIFSLFSIAGFLLSAFPRVLFLPPATFNAGSPSEYAFNDVSEKYKQDERVWIIREEEEIYVLFAKCTHLGCTPRWLAAEDKFKCPCHGSGFYRSGMNFEASEATAQASDADLEAARLSVRAELAQDYFQLRALDAQKQLLTETVAAYKKPSTSPTTGTTAASLREETCCKAKPSSGH